MLLFFLFTLFSVLLIKPVFNTELQINMYKLTNTEL